MPASFDLSKKRFGRLLVQTPAFRKKGERGWCCLCDCGVTVPYVPTGSLMAGKTRSCGCGVKIAATTHGQTKSPEFKTWNGMIGRCYVSSSGNFFRYGEKGIKVCKRWRNSFLAFLADMGKKPGPGYSIDRIDGSKGYTSKNCRWATCKQQTNNQKRNRRIKFNGVTKTLSEWTDSLGLRYKTVQMRLTNGWAVEDAFTIPIGRRGPGLHFWKKKKG